MTEYRGYIIEVDDLALSVGATWAKYQYVHKDYDGPEDNRAGHASSIEEAKAEIDEYILDQEEKILAKSCTPSNETDS